MLGGAGTGVVTKRGAAGGEGEIKMYNPEGEVRGLEAWVVQAGGSGGSGGRREAVASSE